MPNDQINPADIAEAKEAYKAYLAHTAAQDDPSIVDSALNAGAKVLHGAGTVLGYPGGIVRTGLAEGSDLIGGTHLTKQGDAWRAITGDAPTTGEMLKNQGVGEMGRLSDVLPYAKKGQGQWYQPEEGGPLDVTGRGAAGFVGDVATDPLNWVTAGLAGSKNAVSATARKLGSAVESGAGGLSRKAARMNPAQAAAYVENPEVVSRIAKTIEDPTKMHILEDQAAAAIRDGRSAVRKTGLDDASKLRELLEGKATEVNASQLAGIDPEIDAILLKNRRATEISPHYPAPAPEMVSVAGNDANQIKRILQSKAEYIPGSVVDTATAAKNREYGDLASRLRQQLEAAEPGVKPLNEAMGQGKELQKALRTAQKNPLPYLASEADQRIAKLSRAQARGGDTGLLDFSHQYGAAKAMTAKDIDDTLLRAAERLGGRAGLRTLDRAQKIATPAVNAVDQVPAWLELYLRNKQHLNQNPGE